MLINQFIIELKVSIFVPFLKIPLDPNRMGMQALPLPKSPVPT